MSELPRRVSDVLRPPTDDLAEKRLWSAIEARRLASRSRARSRVALVATSTVVAVAAAAALLIVYGPWGHAPVATRTDEGPLRTANGALPSVLVLPRGTSARTIRLSDRSTIRLSQAARVRVLESTGRSFVTVLEAGRVDVHVEPHGPRRWVIECGAASVAVVGTRFSIERDDERVSIDVREGVVEVTPSATPSARDRLSAGESVVVPFAHADASSTLAPSPLSGERAGRAASPSDDPSTLAPSPLPGERAGGGESPSDDPSTLAPSPLSGERAGRAASPSDDRSTLAPSPLPGERAGRGESPSDDRSTLAPSRVSGAGRGESPSDDRSTLAPSPVSGERAGGGESPSDDRSWSALLAGGDPRGAWAALAPSERNRIVASGSAEELMRVADAARLSGHPADAARALDALLARHPSHGSAPLAAFTLGRLALDRLGNASRAASAFERALSLGIGRGLREDAMARLVEAHARAGHAGEARAAAERYRAAFPEGRRRAIVDRWSPPPAP